jgi:L-ascorbate metabolism protein UlaG (beta-lactamase superfamily)
MMTAMPTCTLRPFTFSRRAARVAAQSNDRLGGQTSANRDTTAPRRAGKFANSAPIRRAGFWEGLKISWQFMFDMPSNTTPDRPIPVQALSHADLLAAPVNTLFRLGHSTILLKLEDGFYLTDPVFSKRASPVQWAGPERFHDSPIALADLPPLKAVILSHDHYDHLDHAAVLQLAGKTERFLTPLGVGDVLIDWGIDPAKVSQLDWWQAINLNGIRFVATPAQHFSGRGISDGNRTLWASWVIHTPAVKVFFSGDSGYFAGFKQIGEQFGPFDITLVETGAYNKQWPHVHMQPEQSLQAHLDLRGKQLMPIYNGTFRLAMHSWHEPFDRIMDLAQQHQVPISTPRMGEAVSIVQPQAGSRWWLAEAGQAVAPGSHLAAA